MAFTAEEQKLYDFAKAALPKFLFEVPRAEEEMGALVKIFDGARAQILAFFEQALIQQATGAAPDFLDLHARDRGTSRQDGEIDSDLRQRLRTIEDALTRPLLLAQIQTILDAVPIVGVAAMVEFKQDGAFLGDYTSDAALDGGTFTALTGDEIKFEPNTPFQLPLLIDYAGSGNRGAPQIALSNCLSPANDGTFAVKRLDGNGVVYDNAAGVAEVDAGADWAVQKRDEQANVIDGFERSHVGRGYRLMSTGLIIILPFGCTASTEASVNEMLRLKKGAGVLHVIECRANP